MVTAKHGPKAILIAIAVSLVSVVAPSQSSAQAPELPGALQAAQEAVCPSANVLSSLLLTNVCWECFFPLRIMGANVINMGGNRAPDRAAGGTCFCPGCGLIGTFGVTVGMWQPARMLETVRQPFCFPGLGGLTIPNLSPFVSSVSFGVNRSTTATEDAFEGTSFSHFHYYSMPILAMLGLIDIFDCLDSGISDFDLMWMSETFPNWNDDTLSTFLNPESVLFGNPIALLAQPIDCLGANIYRPVDSLFWMAGCWGTNYPLGGTTNHKYSALKAASLRVNRSLFMLHRIGMARRQGGRDAVCRGVREPIMTKSFYRKQHYWPLPETGRRMPIWDSGEDGSFDFPFPSLSFLPTCCHALGASQILWGEHRQIPGRAEDSLHLIWRWNDCCVGICI